MILADFDVVLGDAVGGGGTNSTKFSLGEVGVGDRLGALAATFARSSSSRLKL